ncbi:MAG: prepilin-type N-terminal cleavage/methylation domain-containing protein, partial [Phycisphaerales bacterium]|nr:prepilin-type N-terminal cleavage/methylation domain-containing protein [Phycisphaerales bacterium]
MRRAFSLLEIMIAIAVLVMLAIAMSTFLRMLTDRREVVLALAHQQRAATNVIEHLEQDLFRTVARARDEAGIRGTPESIVVHSRGVGAAL